MKSFFYLLLFWIAAVHLCSGKSRLLESDPEVIYTQDFVNKEKVTLKVVKNSLIYATKKGGIKYGRLRVGTTAELIGFTDRAFKIRGHTDSGKASGWVSPKAFEAKDPKFLESYKEIYEREMEVRKLIAQKILAIGMTPEEVFAILGEPTKKHSRITAVGQNGLWEYLKTEEVKHYNQVRDPFTGAVYRKYSHSTHEIKSRLGVEFTKGALTAIEESESKLKKTGQRIVAFPICLKL